MQALASIRLAMRQKAWSHSAPAKLAPHAGVHVVQAGYDQLMGAVGKIVRAISGADTLSKEASDALAATHLRQWCLGGVQDCARHQRG